MSTLPTSIVLGQGTMGQTTGRPIAIELADVKRHVLFTGGSGSGKTWAMKVLLEGLLVRGVPGLIIDTMGDLLGLGLPTVSPDDYERYGLLPPHPDPSADEWKLGGKVAALVASRVHPRVLTPCSTAGEQVSILPLTGQPVGYDRIPADELILQADAQASNFLTRIGIKLSKQGGGAADNLDLGAATEVLLRCWREDMDLTGAEGLQAFGKALLHSPSPVLSEPAKSRIKAGLTSMELGRQKLWYDGVPLDFDRLLTSNDGRTPLLLVSVAHLDPADRVFVISQILHAAYNWCASKGASPDRPRLAVVVDELAGDGGKNPILAPETMRSHPSSEAIRRIARQGRHSGCSLICATQSPNDVGYKTFSQFSTTFIGRLRTTMDISRAVGGASMDERAREKLIEFVGTSPSGQMFMVNTVGQFDRLKLRMLGTAHCTVQRQDIERYYAQGIWVKAANARRSEDAPYARVVAQLEGMVREPSNLPADAQDHIHAALESLKAAGRPRLAQTA